MVYYFVACMNTVSLTFFCFEAYLHHTPAVFIKVMVHSYCMVLPRLLWIFRLSCEMEMHRTAFLQLGFNSAFFQANGQTYGDEDDDDDVDDGGDDD